MGNYLEGKENCNVEKAVENVNNYLLLALSVNIM